MPTLKPDRREVRTVSADEVRRLLGPLDDDAVTQILHIGPSFTELEVVARYMEGEGDRVDRVGHPLSGRAAQVYEILRSLEEDLEEMAPRA
jgi:hypothetical protein